jgi:serine/threonine protein kinase
MKRRSLTLRRKSSRDVWKLRVRIGDDPPGAASKRYAVTRDVDLPTFRNAPTGEIIRIERLTSMLPINGDCPWQDKGMQPSRPLPDEQKLGHYEILGMLGQGGYGVVYKARDTRLERLVALKVLSSRRVADEKDRRRFMQEAQSASALSHPNIVTIYEIASAGGKHYIAMEYVEGRTLRELTGQPLDVPLLIAIFRQVAEGMAAAHAGGIVHRDMKPANVMLRADGYIKILDFGLARLANTPGTEDETRTQLTHPGSVVGTANYMSPEQVRGEAAESTSDVFATGLVFYELATGKHPFMSGAPGACLPGILTGTPIPPSKLNPEIPAALDSLILTMLAKEKARRPNFAAVKTALAAMERVRGAPTLPAPLARRNSVGREEELRRLRSAFASVSAGAGMMVTVCGDAGMGKTTLAEDFLAGIEAEYAAAWVGRGRCSERLAETDAFVPIFESLDGLLRAESGDRAAHVMKTIAPTWYVQLSPLMGESTELLAKEAKTASHERMRREFVSFFEELSRTRPVVLFLDDLHWVDASTCDLLAYLGARMRNIRILILTTYRPAAVLARKHPFLPLKLELEHRGVCQDVPLSFLGLSDIERYVATQFASNLFPPEFTRAVYERTEGNPLFMTDMLRYLHDRRILVEQGGRWLLAEPVTEIRYPFPFGIRRLLRLLYDQLSIVDRRN